MPKVLLCALLAAGCSGCTGSASKERDCPLGQTAADPDGFGLRCVDQDSGCFSASECTTADPCCTATCADLDGDFSFACEETCRRPSCDDAADCSGDDLCAIYSECAAECVPDLGCAEGEIVADPDGTGFRCIPADSTCFMPADCAPSIDPCCEAGCAADPGGRFTCQETCESEAGGVGAGLVKDPGFDCHRDSECELSRGEGFICDGCPGFCVQINLCSIDDDCALATRVDECCSCQEAFTRTVISVEPCIVGPGAEPPDECAVECGDVKCEECVVPKGVACESGSCVAVF